jgi:hypothetical protein
MSGNSSWSDLHTVPIVSREEPPLRPSVASADTHTPRSM